MTRLARIISPVLCGLLTLAPAIALAAPAKAKSSPPAESEAPEAGPPERAVEAYRRGTELYNEANFEAALEAFQEAATLYASPDFQFNIAKCYERLGKLEEAVRHYQTYLRTADDSSDRAVVESTVEDLERRIEAEKNRPDPEPEPEPEQAPEPVTNPGRALVITGGALLGVGVAVGLGGGLGFGIPVSRDNASLGDVRDGNPDRLTFAEADEIAIRASRNQTIERIMIGAGGALAITGVALLAVGLSKNKKAAGSAARLSVSPMWGRTGGGLTLQGNF
ncbi:tetratricopeptide repeat protein [Enhygromyxa salina]|uniref:Tetratricopeptide repeat protein n=1 Tax=Enhygromyxa salina TaxID=215803 RepID=A0A2S9YN03_9BACT|nr:tetratricopeptide repeat protein [Enhygromyxa salina]PRQ06462.1 Tetratricopeptide repeat protein [Enhygromyxa salina]